MDQIKINCLIEVKTAMNKCPHNNTGSYSPNGIYLYVRCHDCWELLCVSEIGKAQLKNCPGYEPEKKSYNRFCVHCGFDFFDHYPEVVNKL